MSQAAPIDLAAVRARREMDLRPLPDQAMDPRSARRAEAGEAEALGAALLFLGCVVLLLAAAILKHCGG